MRLARLLLCSALFLTLDSRIFAQETVARNIVDHAIERMGGAAAWTTAGAATAQADILLNNLPSQQIIWSDDWSTGHPKFRRSSKDETKRSAIVGNEHTRVLLSIDGRARSIPAENNLAALAIGYPAAALSIGLRRSECHFVTRTAPNSTDDIRISEQCPGSASSGPPIILDWSFSRATGLPTTLRRPLRDIIAGRTLWETVIYTTFQEIDGLRVPSELAVIKPNGAKEAIRVTETKFATSLPEATFSVQNGGLEK